MKCYGTLPRTIVRNRKRRGSGPTWSIGMGRRINNAALMPSVLARHCCSVHRQQLPSLSWRLVTMQHVYLQVSIISVVNQKKKNCKVWRKRWNCPEIRRTDVYIELYLPTTSTFIGWNVWGMNREFHIWIFNGQYLEAIHRRASRMWGRMSHCHIRKASNNPRVRSSLSTSSRSSSSFLECVSCLSVKQIAKVS